MTTMTALNLNHRADAPASTTAGGDRRHRPLPASPAPSPERLVVHQVEAARAQLAEARERLKAARRRVVELEDAVRNWEELANEVLRRGR
jgi:hypothetical protein